MITAVEFLETGFSYICNGYEPGVFSIRSCSPKELIYLLGLHIDVFGWIKEGLAYDAAKFNSYAN
jgi:hypothetical protein